MKRFLRVAALCLCLLMSFSSVAGAESTAELLEKFTLRYGDRSSNKICITVDDCYKNRREFISQDVELCRQYGVRMTFFPIVYTGCLSEEYRDIWRSVVDSGCEIGSHTYSHLHLGNRDTWGIIGALGRWQEALDKTLGYHYEARWLRPPYGSIEDRKGTGTKRVTNTIKLFGYDHAVNWDVSETDPDKALEKAEGGSILLFHANNKDTRCLEKLIPALLEKGYELVTVSEMFGFDPPETSEELYVYNKADYAGK